MSKRVNVTDEMAVIGVVVPRIKGEKNYMRIFAGIVAAIDTAKRLNPELNKFMFLDDGVGTTQGDLSHVRGGLNVIYGLMIPRGYDLKYRTIKLDIEFYGKEAQKRWVDEMLTYNPSVILVVDDGITAHVKYALTKAEERDIETILVKVPKAEAKNDYK